MRIVLEETDITAIAEAVIQRLIPLMALNAAAPNPQQTPALIAHTPAKPRGDMLKRADLKGITGLSASTIARMESRGQFPARVQLSAKRVAWRRNEVEAWAERRQAA
jgi:predicted DNA-binding transcriptional regulator AlpA